MHMKRNRQKINVKQVVERGKTKLRVETNVTGKIEGEDLRHTGGRAMGKKSSCEGHSTDSMAETFILARRKKSSQKMQGAEIYYSQTGVEDDLRHAGVRFWTCMFQYFQERRTCCRQKGVDD